MTAKSQNSLFKSKLACYLKYYLNNVAIQHQILETVGKIAKLKDMSIHTQIIVQRLHIKIMGITITQTMQMH